MDWCFCEISNTDIKYTVNAFIKSNVVLTFSYMITITFMILIFLIMWISIHFQTQTLFWQGTVLSCDHQMAYLYGYFSPDDLEGLKIKQLIPSLQLPVQGRPLEKVKYQSIVGLLIFYCKRFHIIMLIHLSSENVYQCFI